MGWTTTLIGMLVLLECQNLVSHWRGWVLDVEHERTNDFTIVVPVYGHPRYFQNGEYLETLRQNVLVAAETSTPEMAQFASELAAKGWRVYTVRLRENVGPDTILKAAIADGAVTTKWLVRMDADTYAVDDMGKAIAAADKAGADMCSVKCLVSRPRKLVERMQAVEYEMAMLTRHFRPWMTSGACIIGTTDAYRTVLDLHALNFGTCGGDIETGRIAHHLRMRIRHIDFDVFTEVPGTWRALYRQRMVWWAAGFRTAILNFDTAIRMPVFLLYFTGLVWLGMFWRTEHVIGLESFRFAPMLVLFYTGLCYLTNWQVRSRWMILFPYYSLIQVLIMPLAGAYWCLKYMIVHRTTGRYKFGIRRGRYMKATVAGEGMA